MFKFHATAALLLIALAACDDSPANVTKITGPKDNPFQEKLLALGETDRSLTLRRGIQDGGDSCPRVTASAYQQEHEGMAMWHVRCSNRDWAVYVAPSGSVQARPCEHAAQLGLPQCATLPPRD